MSACELRKAPVAISRATSALTAPQKESLSAFLDQCDLMKFARFEPTEAALRELHESALRLVHETQHDPTPTTPPAPAPLTSA